MESSASKETEKRNKRTALQRSLDLEEKKIKLYEEQVKSSQHTERDGRDDDLQFLQSLLPFVKRVKDKLGFRSHLMTVINDSMKSEELDNLNF